MNAVLTPSFWEYEYFFANKDIVIIGAGLTGLSAAIHLKKLLPQKNILVVEKALLGTMATTRNAGFICIGSPTELAGDIDAYGSDHVFELLQLKARGINTLLQLGRKKNIGYASVKAYELFDSNSPLEKVAHRLDELNIIIKAATGMDAYYTIAQPALLHQFGFQSFDKLVKFKYEGQLQSAAFDHSMRLYAQNLGVTILSGLSIDKVAYDGKKWVLTTAVGDFTVPILLLSNNAFVSELMPKAMVEPHRAQVLVSEPLPHLPFRANFHYDEGYYYFRSYGNRLLLGGARNTAFEAEATATSTITAQIQDILEKMARERLIPTQPLIFNHRWSGIMGFTQDKKPICKSIGQNAYVAAGLNGMGVAIGAALGQDIARQIAEEQFGVKPSRKF
jgi:glycine/D-amino acid oxidase-like deaminating enzyme